MKIAFDTEDDMMFFTLGQVCAFLEKPTFVEAVIEALDAPGGDNTRNQLLGLHVTLGLILADRHATSH